MSIVINDKRKVTRDRTSENRARFLRRIKGTIKDQLPDIIGGKSLKDMDKTGGDVTINRKTITEPQIWHTDGGNVDQVLPGNDSYVPGDEILKPRGGRGRGKGKQASDGPNSEDDFVIELSPKEFMDLFFEDLELPDMMKTQLTKVKEYRRENAGFQTEGSPNRLAIGRSYMQSFKRRLMISSIIKSKIAALEQLLFVLSGKASDNPELLKFDPVMLELRETVIDTSNLPDKGTLESNFLIATVEAEIEHLTSRLSSMALFEEMDMRYRTVVRREIPVAHATMMMIMDNSGSMGEKEKTIARKFFWLLYSFLRRVYETVDMVFISHTTEAHEMDEEEFFNTRESGGTIVSSALDLTSSIIKTRLLNKTNIYIAQVSDGDNVDTDNGTCAEILTDEILPNIRYMAYVQVDDYHNEGSQMTTIGSLLGGYGRGLWNAYHNISKDNPRLQMKRVNSEKDIYPVFRDLFKKETT